MLDANGLAGKWVSALLKEFFVQQSAAYSEKLFIKISGFNESNITSLLNELKENNELNQYYEPIIRTITPVQGFPMFECNHVETSTWLRNNTKSKQALIIILNEATAEAQSLENMFGIDEARLLGKEGLEVLYRILVEENVVFSQEVDSLRLFFEMYNTFAEPQLQNMLHFLTEISQNTIDSIYDRIQKNLPCVNLFRDSRLTIKKTSLTRLRKNYQLAHLQNSGRNLDGDKLLASLDNYIAGSDPKDELWMVVTPEQFRNEAILFIDRQSSEFLKYDLETVQTVFNYKERGPGKLEDKVVKALLDHKDNFDKDQIKLIDEASKAIAAEENPELIQEFVDEFENHLSVPLFKQVNKFVERLLHPSEYSDVFHAIRYEAFRIIEEINTDDLQEDCHFILKVTNGKLNEDTIDFLKIHLLNIEQLIPLVKFEHSSLNVSENPDKDQEVQFELQLINGEQKLKACSFKLSGYTNNLLATINEIESGNLPYFRIYADNEPEVINVVTEIKSQVQHYLTAKEPNIEENLVRFVDFSNYYQEILKQAISDGIASVDYKELIVNLEELMKHVFDSVTVSRHILKYINVIGVHDELKVKKGQIGAVQERIVTIFHPIRFISYLKRLEKVGKEIEHWFCSVRAGNFSVENTELYLEHVFEQSSSLAPHYFVNDSEVGTYLVERSELMGEGKFLLNSVVDNSEQLIEAFSSEFIKTVKNYTEVYPYATDCLDVLFLYCSNAELITRTIDSLFKSTNIKKLNITVHSVAHGAKLHQHLNGWLLQKEEYTSVGENTKFPKVNINVVAESDINKISSDIEKCMKDADIAVLIDYFSQSNQVQYRLEKTQAKDSKNWFETIYKDPLNKDESIKRISYVSEHLPEAMQYFYQLQFILETHSMPSKDELYLLKSIISLTNIKENFLIDFMHDKFNWSLIMDRYLDKSLLRQASPKAQVIQFKSKVGTNKKYKIILSSSKYIRKLSNSSIDHAYYDRLYKKFVSLLKNKQIDREKVIEAVELVKEIAGGIVLKAIGPGKFSHEMLATYLAIQARKIEDGSLEIYTICDELPWFVSNQRRPDMVLTKFSRNENRYKIIFDIIELKLINHNLFEAERFDAIKQITTGENLYQRLFNFNSEQMDADLWRKELLHHLIELKTFSPEHANLLRELQYVSLDQIDVEIKSAIDTFVYTSNLNAYSFETLENGILHETLDGEYSNRIYNRTYILNALGVNNESIEPVFVELNSKPEELMEQIVRQYVDIEKRANEDLEKVEVEIPEIEAGRLEDEDQETEKELEIEKEPKEKLNEVSEVGSETFPEVIALVGHENLPEQEDPEIEELKDHYIRKLKINFNQNDVPITIKDSVIGSSVVRIILDLPRGMTASKITNRAHDIQLWLGLDTAPHIFIDSRGINIDIIRPKPKTIYFEHFMKMVRLQLGDKINGTNLIAPLGIDQINDVLYLDFSSSDTPHLLTGGRTGSGKSVTLNSIILGMMCLYSPADVQFIFIDPKKVEFTVYQNRAHTREVITEIDEAVDVLENLIVEMEKRYTLFARETVTSIEQYKEVMDESLPRIVLVFDEFADFMMQEKTISARVETAILKLSQKARAAGIHLIICTQNPKADIVPTNIRNNLGARLALRATDHHASTIILGEEGAERLAGKGDFLAKTDAPVIKRGKSPFLTTIVKRSLLKYFEKKEIDSADYITSLL
ncbi:FtsK/SpoIIIE domain-containing protein [Paenibacillus planticolens]|uniref:DNA translocase FtsK n=1 Tax=Paenibacillus planticolens TaxID=2654976 RepID=A0ABX1ZL02_9BACL|nr:FtsK/SpoIIIE domain-containing protein [Paenibacillus planticolens]NOU99526.1 DNA translocase FtsK [Paenibacillus planticolens]